MCDRQINVELFQNSTEVRVAILAITACSVGLTLTAASHVVFGEMYFTPSTMVQAEDRTHRIGQFDSNVTIHYLYARNTLDCLIYWSLKAKFSVCERTLDRTNDGLGIEEMNEEEFKEYANGLFSIDKQELEICKKEVQADFEEKVV